jgi:hypothetical protein
MTAFKLIARPAALVLGLVAMTCVSASSARAEGGYLWYESALAAPANALVSMYRHVRHPKVVRVAPAPATPQPILVSAAEPRSDCFWCNRRVFVSGLSF